MKGEVLEFSFGGNASFVTTYTVKPKDSVSKRPVGCSTRVQFPRFEAIAIEQVDSGGSYISAFFETFKLVLNLLRSTNVTVSSILPDRDLVSRF